MSMPDHVRAPSPGLTDMVMVSAAMLGALMALRLVSTVGPVAFFAALGGMLVVIGFLVARSSAGPSAGAGHATPPSPPGGESGGVGRLSSVPRPPTAQEAKPRERR